MFDFHKDKKKYFDIQYWVSKFYIIPYLDINKKPSHILEVGCAEAGVLKAFIEEGHTAVGIELSEERAELAGIFLKKEIAEGKLKIFAKNIFDIDVNKDHLLKFDYVILKDVIEHIHNQSLFISKLKDLLLPNGQVFFAYPPWWMPFGGHQQICKNRFISKLPWFHLLPGSWYTQILRWAGENEITISELLEIKQTGITIEKIHSILEQENFEVVKEKFWLTNPIYVKKFGFRPFVSIINIPYLRNIYCTAHYIVFKLKS